MLCRTTAALLPHLLRLRAGLGAAQQLSKMNFHETFAEGGAKRSPARPFRSMGSEFLLCFSFSFLNMFALAVFFFPGGGGGSLGCSFVFFGGGRFAGFDFTPSPKYRQQSRLWGVVGVAFGENWAIISPGNSGYSLAHFARNIKV